MILLSYRKEFNLATLSNNIKKRRNELNMTQEELAKKTGYKTKGAISRIEKGERDLSQSQIEIFANALSTTPSYLMGWEDDKKSENIKPISPLSPEEKQILDPYKQLNPEGQEKAISYTWDLVDSNKYNKDNQTKIPTRQEMISYLSDMEMAAIDGELNIHTMTDENLYSFYKMIKEDDK